MKKTYWWRIIVLFSGLVVFGYNCLTSYARNLGLCEVRDGVEYCMFNPDTYVNLFGILSMSLIIISIPLFFITDKVFLKWLRFAIFWIILSLILVAITPEKHAFFPMDPDKEMVSVWMGILFVFISLVKIIWDSRREKYTK